MCDKIIFNISEHSKSLVKGIIESYYIHYSKSQICAKKEGSMLLQSVNRCMQDACSYF